MRRVLPVASHSVRQAYGQAAHAVHESGLLKWPFDGERCLQYWYKNGAKTDKGMYHIDCYTCIQVLPL